MRILVLGGTRQARLLADELVGRGAEVTTSLAGRTSRALLPAGTVRVGGFGGIDGLARWLAEHPMDAVVDATHPFAATMHTNAFEACRIAGVPMVHFSRPSWGERPESQNWTWVRDHAQAAEACLRLGGRVLLTVGRQNLEAYHQLDDVIARVAEDDGRPHPSGWRLLAARAPFTLEAEHELLAGVDVLVTKDAGGLESATKLDAALELGTTVVMIARAALAGPSLLTQDEVVEWLEKKWPSTRR